MLTKSKKGQVLKKIKLKDAFTVFEDNKFYIPVEMSALSAGFFKVEKILVAFTPVQFTTVVTKPFHIKSNVENMKSFSNSDVVDEKNSEIFKSIYSKNIVNSKDQVSFEGNVFNVNLPTSQSDIFELVTSTELSDVFNATRSGLRAFSSSVSERGIEFTKRLDLSQGADRPYNSIGLNDFFIRVYALNDKNEVIDNIEVRSQNIQSYIENEDVLAQQRKLNVLSSRLNESLDGFSLNLKKFSFTSDSNDERIEIAESTGTELIVNDLSISEIIESGMSVGLLVDLDFYLIDDLSSSNPLSLELISIKSSNFQTYTENGLSQVDILRRNFKTSCLKNQAYKDMIVNLYNKAINKNLSSIKTYYKVVLRTSNTLSNFGKTEEIALSKEEYFTIENLTQAFEDIQNFNFSDDIKNKRVFNASVTKFINSRDYLNKLTLTFNNSLHNQQKVFKNSISFDFIVYDDTAPTGQRSVSVNEFYFDKKLSEGNLIYINANNKIENYIDDGSNIDVYFSLNSIKEVFINFHNTFNLSQNSDSETISVGPFVVSDQRLLDEYNTSRQEIQEFRFLDKKIKEKIQMIMQERMSNLDMILNLINSESINQMFVFKLNDFVNDNLQNIQNLDFFPDVLPSTLSNILSSEDVRSEVLGSILVKIEKSMLINRETLFSIEHYCFLCDITSNRLEEDIIFNIENYGNTKGLEKLNIFDNDSINKTDLESLINNRANRLSDDFECSFRISLETILINQKVTSCLGSPKRKSLQETNESKDKLAELIFNLNPNYGSFDLSNILNLGYEKSFNDNRQDFVKEVFKITKLSNSPGKVLQDISVTKEDLL